MNITEISNFCIFYELQPLIFLLWVLPMIEQQVFKFVISQKQVWIAYEEGRFRVSSLNICQYDGKDLCTICEKDIKHNAEIALSWSLSSTCAKDEESTSALKVEVCWLRRKVKDNPFVPKKTEFEMQLWMEKKITKARYSYPYHDE